MSTSPILRIRYKLRLSDLQMLLPPEGVFRFQYILVGGASLVALGSRHHTADVDNLSQWVLI